MRKLIATYMNISSVFFSEEKKFFEVDVKDEERK